MDIHHNQTDVAIPNDIKIEWGFNTCSNKASATKRLVSVKNNMIKL